VDKLVGNTMDKFGDLVWINCGKLPLHAKIGCWRKVIPFLCRTYTEVFHRFL